MVLTDANVLSDAEILTAWRTCEREQRPMVLAINEWPLFVLRRHPDADGFAPLTEALRQVQQAVFFLDAPGRTVFQSCAGHRSESSERARSPRHTGGHRASAHERFYTDLPNGDPARTNRDALRDARVQKRLITILERVAAQGHHATMRQLIGFVAYLITGGRTSVERLANPGSQDSHYSMLAFDNSATGPLFEAVRATLDPAVVTHPRHDADLWRGSTDHEGWD